ncbi:helix-turn-helix domain-containing protein [Arthrobacter sp. R-11]|uniref:helix-turn-helix domain-containing protein n=1 Tax=Arthrobacter sp. R-11 TaxID=3404053 RepID=UPI003CEA3D59
MGEARTRRRSAAVQEAQEIGATQEKLSEISGVSTNQISNIERGRNNTKSKSGKGTDPGNTTLRILFKLDTALDIPVIDVLPDAFHRRAGE